MNQLKYLRLADGLKLDHLMGEFIKSQTEKTVSYVREIDGEDKVISISIKIGNEELLKLQRSYSDSCILKKESPLAEWVEFATDFPFLNKYGVLFSKQDSFECDAPEWLAETFEIVGVERVNELSKRECRLAPEEAYKTFADTGKIAWDKSIKHDKVVIYVGN